MDLRFARMKNFVGGEFVSMHGRPPHGAGRHQTIGQALKVEAFTTVNGGMYSVTLALLEG